MSTTPQLGDYDLLGQDQPQIPMRPNPPVPMRPISESAMRQGVMQPEAAQQPAQPPQMKPMGANLPVSDRTMTPPQESVGVQEPSQQKYHDELHWRKLRDAQLTGRMAALTSDPNHPGAFQAQMGDLLAEQMKNKADTEHYKQTNPWGTPESAHPGMMGKVGHVLGEIGQGFVPSPDIPGSQGRMNAVQNAALVGEKAGGETGLRGAQTEAAEAQAPLRGAQADLANTKANAAPAAARQNPQQLLAADIAADRAKGMTPEQVDQDPGIQQDKDAITDIQRQPNPRQEEALDRQYNDAIANGDHETAERLLKVKRDLAMAGQAPQRAPQALMIPQGGGAAEVVRPGTNVAPGAQTPSGFATENRPTTQMRNAAAQAKVAVDGIPDTIAEVNRLKGKLGPIAGRWNDFMQGKIGMEDPDFAGLQMDMVMLSSAVALAHARGRLPENLRAEFDSMIHAPKQTPDNIVSVLNHIKPWMERMEQMGEPGSSSGATQAGGGGGQMIRARDPQGKLHEAPAGTAMPQGWKAEK